MDGTEHIIRETGTADPVNAKASLTNTVFLPEGLLPKPLARTWSDTRGANLVLLDTRGVEGSHDGTGGFVGTSFIFSDRAVLNTLEGDPPFFFATSA